MQVPNGAGIAFAHKYKHEPNVCVTMYGDGAANQVGLQSLRLFTAAVKFLFLRRVITSTMHSKITTIAQK